MSIQAKSKRTVCSETKYSRDIEPYPLVKIYAGVGSGKSYFAGKMITGSTEYGIPEQTVLIITSRRAKVEETLREMGVAITDHITKDGNLNFEVLQTGEEEPYEYQKYVKRIKSTDVLGEHTFSTYNKSVICTNSFISAYLRGVYDPEDPMTHIWNKFDAIVIDEVHSLVTDATYQSATFDVLAFIREYLRYCQNKQLQEDACKHLILMTGTPAPFEALVSFDFPDELTNELNLFERCENVIPENVVLIDFLTARERINTLLSEKQKVFYFTNLTLSESEARSKFEIADTVNVGVSFSKESKRKRLTKEELEKIDSINESIRNNSLIPDAIQFFATTSRNKEGINIHNKDYRNMFVETRLMYDAVQMAGRVRAGIENLYIITNVAQHNGDTAKTDIPFSKKIMVSTPDITDSQDEANQYLIKEYFENDYELRKEKEVRRANIMRYVKYIEDRFDYVRYNVFSQRFEFFYVKQRAEEMAILQVEKFNVMLESNDNSFVKLWFPNSNVRRELSLKERATVYLKHIIGRENQIKVSKDELKNHLSFVRNLFGSNLKNANPILHLVDKKFNCVESGKGYILYYGDTDPKVHKKAMKKKRNC